VLRLYALTVPALEDKIVQRATVEVLNAIYETDFAGFSYGFRPGRSQHNALDALYVGLLTKKVNWVLDLDIRGFFDTIDHGWLVKFVEHRIADQRVVRLIQKWLSAGVLADGKHMRVEEGTPQGGSATDTGTVSALPPATTTEPLKGPPAPSQPREVGLAEARLRLAMGLAQMIASASVPVLWLGGAPSAVVAGAILLACLLTGLSIARWGGFWRKS
jgi:Reverse transcriptase (RNA-dependent DNA polymerase)